jgi:hypothetical protein
MAWVFQCWALRITSGAVSAKSIQSALAYSRAGRQLKEWGRMKERGPELSREATPLAQK